MIKLSVSITPTNPIFERAGQSLKGAAIMAAEEVGKYLVNAVKARFDAGGPGWPAKWNGEPSHLTMSGELKGSIKYLRNGFGVMIKAQRGGGTNKNRYSGKNIFIGRTKFGRGNVVGGGIDVAALHERGGGKFPRRAYMEPTAIAEAATVKSIYAKHLMAALGN